MNYFSFLKSALFILFICGCTNLGVAQNQLKASKEIIEEGIKAYDSSDYKKAVQLFSSIPEGDTNYVIAQYELALSYTADSAFDQSIKTAQNALQFPNAEKRTFLILIANAYDYKGFKDSALHYYRLLHQMNPNDHHPIFEMGVVHFRKAEYDSAIKYLQESVLINPNHFRSHQLLGVSYALQGRLTEAWICIQTSLLYADNYESARKPIIYLDGIGRQTDEYSEAYKNRKEEYSHPLFDEIDAIINAKIVLNEQYKIKSDLNGEPQAKATYAIMEKLKYEKTDHNFVMQYYVPLWLDIKDKDLIEPFFLQMYSGYKFELIEKLAAHQKSNMNKVREIVYPYMNLILATRTLNNEARTTAVKKYKYIIKDGVFIEGKLKTIEDFDAGNAAVYKNGTLVAKGAFNANGEKNGEWTYYYTNGKIKSIERLKDGKMIGEEKNWYSNGQLKSIIRYNQQNTLVYEKDFDEYGAPTDEYEILNEKEKKVRHTTLYESGKKKMIILLEKGEYADGKYDSWYENGVVKRQIEIKNGKLTGLCKEFYEDGKLNEEYHYENGKLDGNYKVFHRNGKLMSNSDYRNGQIDGLFEKWDEEGSLIAKYEYSKGKLDGKSFYYDEGIEYGYVTYKDDKAQDYEFKDIKGKMVAADKGPLKSLKIYYSNGNLKSDIPLQDGKVNGLAQYYFYCSPLSEKTNFVADKKDGHQSIFYSTGKLNNESEYKEDQRTGYYKGYFQNGKTMAEGWLENDIKQGLWKYYNVNGTLNSKSFYNAGNINGSSLEYNIKGELVTKECFYEKGMYRLVQFDSAGKEFHRIDFENGNGNYELWYPNTNKPWFQCALVNGRFDGPFSKFYPDGTLMEKGYYLNGTRDSTDTYFSFNGVVTNSGKWKNGNREGELKFYSESGELTHISNYKNNMLDGKVYNYYKGVLNFESNYKEDNRIGEQYVYGEEKKLAVILYFSEGILMSYTYEGKDGKLLPKTEVKNGSGNVVAYYPNGKKSVDLNYKNSKQEGKQTYYYSTGTILEERNFTNSDYNGAYTEYHPNGKVKLSTTYVDDEHHGLYQEFDESGNVLVSKNYFYGTLHGLSEVIDPKTKVSKKMMYRYGYPL